MKLEEMTWPEVEIYLKSQRGIILPTGSIEQHGPIGLIGTDIICAREIAWAASEYCGAIVAPALSYAPAPFNMSFPGTLSISDEIYTPLVCEILKGMVHHGFEKLYILNGHGANLAPLREAACGVDAHVSIRSWWDFEKVNALRSKWYGDWEGMHATPSEVSITQHTHRRIDNPDLPPPRKLSPAFVKAHAGDKHGPAEQHRLAFPDGRVGSHSGLAQPEHGALLLATAAEEIAADYLSFIQ